MGERLDDFVVPHGIVAHEASVGVVLQESAKEKGLRGEEGWLPGHADFSHRLVGVARDESDFGVDTTSAPGLAEPRVETIGVVMRDGGRLDVRFDNLSRVQGLVEETRALGDHPGGYLRVLETIHEPHAATHVGLRAARDFGRVLVLSEDGLAIVTNRRPCCAKTENALPAEIRKLGRLELDKSWRPSGRASPRATSSGQRTYSGDRRGKRGEGTAKTLEAATGEKESAASEADQLLQGSETMHKVAETDPV
mmetsp:Transcript_74549/g.207144  ORF Transcript_74549/g.207144 Transcript_74549/m.207144 type:complete len:252 (-) Transcript_74549:752-1507(-)